MAKGHDNAFSSAAMPCQVLTAGLDGGGEAQEWRPDQQKANFPLLRALLSRPPQCPMPEKQRLMQHITSTLLYQESGPVRDVPHRPKPRKPTNGQKRRSSAKRGSTIGCQKESDMAQFRCSPDTTVGSPLKMAPSVPKVAAHESRDYSLSAEQQSFLFNLFSSHSIFTDQEKVHLAARMGITEHRMIQWLSDQYTLRANGQAQSRNTSTVEVVQGTPATVLNHRKHGMVEYYPMQQQGHYVPKPIPHPPMRTIEQPPKRTRYEPTAPTNVYHSPYQYHFQGYHQAQYHPAYMYSYGDHWQPKYVQSTPSGHGVVLDQSRYQMVTPPDSEPKVQEQPNTLESQVNNAIMNSFYLDDFYAVKSESSFQRVPQYEDISPSEDAPLVSFHNLHEGPQSSPASYDSAQHSLGSHDEATNPDYSNGGVVELSTLSPVTLEPDIPSDPESGHLMTNS